MNLVVLHTDQQRFDSLGCTGNRHARTPNIDRLATESTLYSRCFSANPVCMPSRASLLSGLYPAAHGVWNNGIPLPRREHVVTTDHNRRIQADAGMYPPHVLTLADTLSDSGYRTHSVGKLHLTPTEVATDYSLPESRWLWEKGARNEWSGPYCGFESVEISLHHGEMVSGHYRYWLEDNYPKVADRVKIGPFPAAPDLPGAPGGFRPGVIPEEAHHSTWCAERAVRYLNAAASHDEPFFLWVGFPDPHSPWTPPESLAKEFSGTGALTSTFDRPRPESTGLTPLWDTRLDLRAAGGDASTVARIREYTDAQIHLIDSAVGRILDALAANGQRDDTVVVFTSDHGDFLGDYGLVRKAGYPARSLCNVPLIVSVPGRSGGDLVRQPVSQVDLLPTILDALQVAHPGEPIDGVSVLDGVPDDHLALVQTFATTSTRSFSAVDERYRLTYYPDSNEYELYDHEADPYELDNLGSVAGIGPDRARLVAEHLDTVRLQSGWVGTW